MLFVGVDPAWGEGTRTRPPNETGLARIAGSREVIDAGWARGLTDTLAWIEKVTGSEDAVVAVDAPLVVTNSSGQRLCEKQVGQRYGRWQVSANTTNTSSSRQAGVALLSGLKDLGFAYSDGWAGPPANARHVFECYPYTTIAGVTELGYDVERPRYKRKPKAMNAATFRPLRAAACDELIGRMITLRARLRSRPSSRLRVWSNVGSARGASAHGCRAVGRSRAYRPLSVDRIATAACH